MFLKEPESYASLGPVCREAGAWSGLIEYLDALFDLIDDDCLGFLKQITPGLSRDLKGSMMLRGIGNSMMALRNRLHGCTESDVIWKLANSTMSWSNTNFSGLMVIPFHQLMSSHLHT